MNSLPNYQQYSVLHNREDSGLVRCLKKASLTMLLILRYKRNTSLKSEDTAIGYEASWSGVFPHPEE